MIRDKVYGLVFAAAGRLAGLPVGEDYELRTKMLGDKQERPTVPGLRGTGQLTRLVLRPLTAEHGRRRAGR